MTTQTETKPETQAAETASRRGLATIPDAMRYLSLSQSTIYKLISEGKIPVVKIGRNVRIPWAHLEHVAASAVARR